jgi:hypothetical protein
VTHELFLTNFCGYDNSVGIPLNKYFFAYHKEHPDIPDFTPTKFKKWFYQKLIESEENFTWITQDSIVLIYMSILNARIMWDWVLKQEYK